MLPAGLLAKAIHLCAAGMIAAGVPAPANENLYVINVHAGATLRQQPTNAADAAATVRDLLARGADFDAGPLGINGRDFERDGVTPASAFSPCALGHVEADAPTSSETGLPAVSDVVALVRQAFGARITDTLRPVNASYGALHSWHKVGQAVDFVPAGGVMAINREQIRTLMAAHGIRLLELLGPGDPGHANHWHVAFARPGQSIDHKLMQEGDEDWIVTPSLASALPAPRIDKADAPSAPAPTLHLAAKAPPAWDVFASARWRQSQGDGS